MPALLLLLISLLYLTGTVTIARGEDTFELRQKKGLLLFEDFQHWAGFLYRYGGHDSNQSNSSKSSSHAFEESYNFSLTAAIIEPHIFNANLVGGILYDQERSRNGDASTASSNATYQYNFIGIGLDKSPTPFTLLSYRNRVTVDSTYSSPTTSDTVGTEFGMAIKNSLLLSRVQLSRTTAESSGGGGGGSSSAGNAFSYSVEHSVGALSTTTLALSFSDQAGHGNAGTTQKASANSLNVTNGLSLGTEGNYSLMTSFQLINADTNSSIQHNLSVSELLQARFGKAMRFEASYSLAKSESSVASGYAQENTQHRGEVSLTHKLFSSLETSLRGRGALNRLNDGTEDRFGGMGSVRYTKQLPAESYMSVGVTRDYEVVDRQVVSPLTTILDEAHNAPHLKWPSIPLGLIGDGFLDRVISVINRDTLDDPYTEGIDYDVNYTLGTIDIRVGTSKITQSSNLKITYVVYKNPQEKYASTTSSISSDLSLFSGKLQGGVGYSEAHQTILKGFDANDAKNMQGDSRTLMMYLGGKYDMFNYRISYRDAVAREKGYRGVEATCDLVWDNGEATVTFMGRDRYYTYDAYEINTSGANTTTGPATPGTKKIPRNVENTGELSLGYLKNLSAVARLTLMANVADVRSDQKGAVDSLSLRAVYFMQLNDIIITVSGQTALALSGGATTRDDSARFELVRYF